MFRVWLHWKAASSEELQTLPSSIVLKVCNQKQLERMQATDVLPEEMKAMAEKRAQSRLKVTNLVSVV